jgi:hypothetical protein
MNLWNKKDNCGSFSFSPFSFPFWFLFILFLFLNFRTLRPENNFLWEGRSPSKNSTQCKECAGRGPGLISGRVSESQMVGPGSCHKLHETAHA